MSVINNAIALAEQSAQAATSTPPPAVVPVTGTAVAVPGKRLTTDQRIDAGFRVTFVSFSDLGTMTLGKEKKQFEKLHLMLELSQVEAGWGFRLGDPVRYIRTSDGVLTDDGRVFEDELATAKKIDPKLKVYNSWRIPFTLLTAVPDHAQGEMLGFTTNWSSFKEFQPFFDKLVEKFGKDASVELNLTCRVAKNSKGDEYGVPVFELIGEVSQD